MARPGGDLPTIWPIWRETYPPVPRYRLSSSKNKDRRLSSDSRSPTSWASRWTSTSSSSSLGAGRSWGCGGFKILSFARASSGVGSRMLVFRRVAVAFNVELAHLLLNRGSRVNRQLSNVDPVMTPKWPLYVPLKIQTRSPTLMAIVMCRECWNVAGKWTKLQSVKTCLEAPCGGKVYHPSFRKNACFWRLLSSCHCQLSGAYLRKVFHIHLRNQVY